MFIAFPPVLRAEDGTCHCNGHEKHILDKLDLRGLGYRSHLILSHFSQHQRISSSDGSQHQALEYDWQGKPDKRVVKTFFVD